MSAWGQLAMFGGNRVIDQMNLEFEYFLERQPKIRFYPGIGEVSGCLRLPGRVDGDLWRLLRKDILVKEFK